jgi:restriction system protein
MPIPNYETIMLPILKFASDDKEHTPKEAREYLSTYFKLTNQEKNNKYPNSNMSIFADRTNWALTYLKKGGLLIGTKRNFFKITELGKLTLSQKPHKIDRQFLKQFPEFLQFIKRKK